MSRATPYQPLLLRLLHGINGLIAILAIITSYWVYDTYDGRFGQLSLPQIPDIIGIHGTFGKTLLLAVMPAFALYSFHLGSKRLVQPNSFQKLRQLGKPIGWYSLHRIVNTVMLLAVTFSLVTGSMVKEEWLPNGELNHIWYYLHLTGWVILVGCLAMHLLISAKVGGLPLWVSMFKLNYRPEDSPKKWIQTLRSFGRHEDR